MPAFLPLNPCAVPSAFIKSVCAVRLDIQSVFGFSCLPFASELGEGLLGPVTPRIPIWFHWGDFPHHREPRPCPADRSQSSLWGSEQRRAAVGPGADLSGSRAPGARPFLSWGPRGSSWRAATGWGEEGREKQEAGSLGAGGPAKGLCKSLVALPLQHRPPSCPMTVIPSLD